jgi:hypothetical protein
MHALAGKRVEIGGEGGDQRLALAGLHLGDVALVQEDAADQLHVEGAQAQCALGALAAIGEGLRQQVVEAFAVLRALRSSAVFSMMPSSVSFSNSGSMALIRSTMPRTRLDLAVVGRAEDLLCDGSQTEHAKRLPVRSPRVGVCLPQIIVWGIRVVRPIVAVYQRRQDGQGPDAEPNSAHKGAPEKCQRGPSASCRGAKS